MDLMKIPRGDYSIGHYARPLTHELVGRGFSLIMDGGYDYELHFTGKDSCTWNRVGETPVESTYEAVKGDDFTYLVDVHYGDFENQVFVLDLEQRLVTRLEFKCGENPKHPLLITTYYDFGAIDTHGYPLPFKRHGFTSEMIGTTVHWHWAPDFFTKHAYLESDYYRITWDDNGQEAEDFDRTNEMLPTTDEHARYIKIKDNLYLFTLTEENEERALGDIQFFRSDNLTLLQNYDRMIHVGRGYGHIMINGNPEPLNIRLTAFGSPVELSEEFLTRPNPFIV